MRIEPLSQSRPIAAAAVVLSFGDQDRGPFIEEKGDRTPLGQPVTFQTGYVTQRASPKKSKS